MVFAYVFMIMGKKRENCKERTGKCYLHMRCVYMIMGNGVGKRDQCYVSQFQYSLVTKTKFMQKFPWHSQTICLSNLSRWKSKLSTVSVHYIYSPYLFAVSISINKFPECLRSTMTMLSSTTPPLAKKILRRKIYSVLCSSITENKKKFLVSVWLRNRY